MCPPPKKKNGLCLIRKYCSSSRTFVFVGLFIVGLSENVCLIASYTFQTPVLTMLPYREYPLSKPGRKLTPFYTCHSSRGQGSTLGLNFISSKTLSHVQLLTLNFFSSKTFLTMGRVDRLTSCSLSPHRPHRTLFLAYVLVLG